MPPPAVNHRFLTEHASLMAESFQHLLGRPLFSETGHDKALVEQLFNAPFAVLSHNTDVDPLYNYANKKALELFELNWDEMTVMPSRLSAEPVNQQDRDKLLAEVTEKGYISHYQGIRVSKSGRRFMIKDAVVWNLLQDGVYKGQAACFDRWEYV